MMPMKKAKAILNDNNAIPYHTLNEPIMGQSRALCCEQRSNRIILILYNIIADKHQTNCLAAT